MELKSIDGFSSNSDSKRTNRRFLQRLWISIGVEETHLDHYMCFMRQLRFAFNSFNEVVNSLYENLYVSLRFRHCCRWHCCEWFVPPMECNKAGEVKSTWNNTSWGPSYNIRVDRKLSGNNFFMNGWKAIQSSDNAIDCCLLLYNIIATINIITCCNPPTFKLNISYARAMAATTRIASVFPFRIICLQLLRSALYLESCWSLQILWMLDFIRTRRLPSHHFNWNELSYHFTVQTQ